jgi:hypothetical protein
MTSGRPDSSRPGVPGVDQASGGFCCINTAFWRKCGKLMLARKLKEDQGDFGSSGTVRNCVCSQTQQGIAHLSSLPNLCYHQRLGTMQRRRFDSGDPMLGEGIRLARTDERMVLRYGYTSILEVAMPPGHGERRETFFLRRCFFTQRRRLANGGATAMSTDPNL